MNSSILGFNGERLDYISGTTHLGNGYRAYNPVVLRFNCPDSISPFGAGGVNQYVYCAGDPINKGDSSGHISGGGIAGMIMGTLGILIAPFTAGQSLTVVSCLIAGLEILSGTTAIASGALENSSPQASSTLGWASLSTGMLSLLSGGIIAGTSKLTQLLGKLRRINGKIGIPMSGEFRNARFLGMNRAGGRVYWNIRFEDTVPLGNRLTVLMGSEWENNILRPVNEVIYNGELQRERYTPSQLLDLVQRRNENYDIYRLIIPESSVASHSLAYRFSRLFPMDRNKVVVGFNIPPRATGVVADNLAYLNAAVSNIESIIGYGNWVPVAAQDTLTHFSETYDATADAITFGFGGIPYPYRYRAPDYDVINW